MSNPVAVSPAQLTQLAPRCLPTYSDAFIDNGALLARYGVNASGLRLAHFMAQILHESAALTVRYENLRYSARRLSQVWPTRFQPTGPLDPEDYAYNEEKLANEVYGGRMGNIHPGDGYRYRGRGLLQLTGRANYARATRLLHEDVPSAPDLEADPDAVLTPPWSLALAAAEWEVRGCNAAADQDNVRLVTRRINGGTVGLEQRRAWLVRTKAMWDA